jgi:putative membrane protein
MSSNNKEYKKKFMNFAMSWTDRSFWKIDRVKIIMLYIFMLAGGLWHVLNILQDVMRLMASVTMILISLWLVYELRKYQTDKGLFQRTLVWLGMVYILSMGVENFGVRSGQIFGNYIYGDTLKPFIGDVPLVIGFAWINMLLASAGVVDLLLKGELIKRTALSVVLIAVLMVIFDIVMEPAAGQLDYWNWASYEIPLQNYIAWFILAMSFTTLGMLLRVLNFGVPKIISHAYFAQLGYFFLVNVK